MGMQELLISLLPMVIALLIIYFLLIRPQKKREKEVQEMRSELKSGDEILTVGGIRGVITQIGKEYITVETGNKSKIQFTRSAVYRVLNESDNQEFKTADIEDQEPENLEETN